MSDVLPAVTGGLHVVAVVPLLAAGVLALRRMAVGPRMLDRIVTLDVFTSILIGSVALVAATQARADLVPVLLALALTGFFGAVALARFTQTDRTADRRILTKEEMQAELAEREQIETDDEAPALFDPDEITEGSTEEHPDSMLASAAVVGDVPDEVAERHDERREAVQGQGEGHEPDAETPVGNVDAAQEEDR